jgi:carboxymethylenebutenolidase
MFALAASAQKTAPAVPENPAVHVPEKDWHALQAQQVWVREKLAKSPRRSQWIDVKNGDREIHAWIVYPRTSGKVPVVLVLHEAFGMTDSTRLTADEIAAMGYIAIAPDMVSGLGPNGGNADSFTELGSVSSVLTHRTDESINSDLNALGDYAEELPSSNGKLAMVGLSWGGGAAFRFVTTEHRKDLKAIFVFYDVGPPKETQKIAAASTALSVEAISVPVYGFYPTRDLRTMAGLQATKDAMAAAGKLFQTVVYQDADHAYMRVYEDPANNNPANKRAYEDSMERLKTRLKKM